VLPSTAIRLSARTLAPGELPSHQDTTYLLLIAPNALTFTQTSQSRGVNAELAVCEFGDRGNSYRFTTQNLPAPVSEEAFRGWQSQGIPGYISVAQNSETRRVRLVVLDVPTGLTGAVDIPVLPQELQKATQPISPPTAVTPVVEIPDKDSPASPPKTADTLSFRVASGQTGSLDWSGEALFYRGDLAIAQSGPAFFNYAFGSKLRCQQGRLVPIGLSSGDPKLLLTFRNRAGKQVTVDLKGDHPAYSGDLPVDSSSQAFFDQVSQLTHCVPN
jgi:hypothetical protein